MSFWIRRTPAGDYAIADLGLVVPGAGAEMDLHLAYSYEALQDSANLATALAADAVTRLTGSGGSTIPAADAFNDSVAVHALNATDSHTGYLERAQLRTPARTVTVASQGADYTTIKAAVTAAIAGGASASTPWAVVVYPGTYAEDPMTIQNGIVLSDLFSTRMDSVFVTANNAAADLFTCTGGYIAGLRVSGVTVPHGHGQHPHGSARHLDP
jgi:pectin methylesterase-like acyl-CoA thioesterase